MNIQPTDTKLAAEATKIGFVAYANHLGIPGLAEVAELAFAVIGAAIERRNVRAIEFTAGIAESGRLTEEILNSEAFQDGFVFALEQYIRERNTEKRVIMKNIFLGYIELDCSDDFPLEELNDLVTRMNFNDIKVLRSAVLRAKYQSELLPPESNRAFKLEIHPFEVGRLINFSLLMEDRQKNSPAVREANDPGYLYVWLSPLGKQLAEYLQGDGSKTLS